MSLNGSKTPLPPKKSQYLSKSCTRLDSIERNQILSFQDSRSDVAWKESDDPSLSTSHEDLNEDASPPRKEKICHPKFCGHLSNQKSISRQFSMNLDDVDYWKRDASVESSISSGSESSYFNIESSKPIPICRPVRNLKSWKSSNDVPKLKRSQSKGTIILSEDKFNILCRELFSANDYRKNEDAAEQLTKVFPTKENIHSTEDNYKSDAEQTSYRSELHINLCHNSTLQLQSLSSNDVVNDSSTGRSNTGNDLPQERKQIHLSSCTSTSSLSAHNFTFVDPCSTDASHCAPISCSRNNSTTPDFVSDANCRRLQYAMSRVNRPDEYVSTSAPSHEVNSSQMYQHGSSKLISNEAFRQTAYANPAFSRSSPSSSSDYSSKITRECGSQTNSFVSLRSALQRELSRIIPQTKSRKTKDYEEYLKKSIDEEFLNPSCTCAPEYVESKKRELLRGYSLDNSLNQTHRMLKISNYIKFPFIGTSTKHENSTDREARTPNLAKSSHHRRSTESIGRKLLKRISSISDSNSLSYQHQETDAVKLLTRVRFVSCSV